MSSWGLSHQTKKIDFWIKSKTDKNQFKKSALLLRVGYTGERVQLEKSPFPVNPPTLSYPASYYASIGLLSKGIEKL